MGSLFLFIADACQPRSDFFGIPTWYKYLEGASQTDSLTGSVTCTPQLVSVQDAWLIGAAVLDILLRVAALLAVAYIVVGGIQYIRSQGQPDATQTAKNTIVNAIVGLVIAVTATVLVTFIAGRFN